MDTITLDTAREHLSKVIESVEQDHERFEITRHGRPVVVLISPEDLSSLEETLEILTTPGEMEAIQEGLADAAAGRFVDNRSIVDRFLR